MISTWVFFFLFYLSTSNYLAVEASNTTTTVEESKSKVVICFKYTVHVINALRSNTHPLNIHCQSRDDDLGSHTLYVGGDFHFKFGLKIFGPKTWFTCDMVWGSKHQHVDVFREKVEGDLCCATQNCYWKAQDDGIYFNNVDERLNIKRYEWLQ